MYILYTFIIILVFNISVEPPLIRHSFGEQTLRSGPSLRLKCVASGNPTPDIAWLLDGEKLSSGERLQIGQFVTADGNVESHLNISSVHTNDGGLYSCIASSKVCIAFEPRTIFRINVAFIIWKFRILKLSGCVIGSWCHAWRPP